MFPNEFVLGANFDKPPSPYSSQHLDGSEGAGGDRFAVDQMGSELGGEGNLPLKRLSGFGQAVVLLWSPRAVEKDIEHDGSGRTRLEAFEQLGMEPAVPTKKVRLSKFQV